MKFLLTLSFFPPHELSRKSAPGPLLPPATFSESFSKLITPALFLPPFFCVLPGKDPPDLSLQDCVSFFLGLLNYVYLRTLLPSGRLSPAPSLSYSREDDPLLYPSIFDMEGLHPNVKSGLLF